ncbi:glycosyltransferase [Persephonella sp. KM09-Lau-8]|uniref:glycosyltransferase n=1 Tax=Persephonella sp. KM09-Lau-8 TaxID=1158345 RepID=UPI000497315A|nr:glycosyltransferase [Persephonella sp. KM09-Lau-8]
MYTPSLKGGGVLESNRLLAEGFRKKGYDVLIISNRKTDIEIDGFTHIYLNAGDLTRPFKLKSIIEREKPIAVFGNMLPQNISLSLAKILIRESPKTKYFGFVRTSSSFIEYKAFYKTPYKTFVRKIYENLDKIIAISSIVKKDLQNAFKVDENKIEVIHNPIDLEYIKIISQEALNEFERNIFSKKTILYVGRFSPEKRLDLLIKIFSLINAKLKNINLVLVGTGEEEKNLKELVKIYNIEKNVFFLPYTANPFKYMKNATIFALTSEQEGFGRVVAESMACETPVIAFENEFSGHKDIVINDYNGILIPFGDINSFVEKAYKILEDTDFYKKLKNNALKSSYSFSSEQVIDKLENLFKG